MASSEEGRRHRSTRRKTADNGAAHGVRSVCAARGGVRRPITVAAAAAAAGE